MTAILQPQDQASSNARVDDCLELDRDALWQGRGVADSLGATREEAKTHAVVEMALDPCRLDRSTVRRRRTGLPDDLNLECRSTVDTWGRPAATANTLLAVVWTAGSVQQALHLYVDYMPSHSSIEQTQMS